MQSKLYVIYIRLSLLLILLGCKDDGSQSDYADALRQKLVEAEAMVKEEKNDEAVEAFFQVVAANPKTLGNGKTSADTTCDEEIFQIVVKALDGIAECSSRVSEPRKLAERMQELDDKPTNLLKKFCLRDLHATTAYLWFRCDDIARAGEMIKKAFDTPMHHPTDERYFRDYAYAGQIFVSDQSMSRQVTDWLELALQHAAKCEIEPTRTSFVRSLLGTIYN